MKRTRPSAAEKRGVLCYSHPRLSKPRMRECRLAINRCARFLRAIRRTTAIRRQRPDRRQEWASPADKPWAPAVSSYKDPSHVPSPPVHPMEDHPAGRALPARRGRLAGRPFGLPHAAQQRAGEKRQYTDARRIGAPAPGSPRGIAGVTHPALFHGCLPVRQGLLPADPVPPRPGAEALPRCLRPARRPDPPGAHRARRQSRGARPVRGLRTQCAGRQGRTVRRPARPGQQRQGTLLPVLGAGHAGTAGIRVDDRVRTRRHQQRAQRRGLQRLVHLPEGKRATLRARSLLRQGRRTPTADDQHRLSPRTGWQGDRRDGPGHQPEQPAGAQRTGNRELYDGVGQVGILSPAGLFAGNSRDAGLLGKNLAKADPQHAGELLQLLAAGKSRLFNENDDLKVLQPLQPIPGAKPWGVLLEVPKSALLGPALALERQLDDMRREGTWVELGLGLGARCSACWCCG